MPGLSILAGCGLAGCGGTAKPDASTPSAARSSLAESGSSLAERVCGGARQAAARTLGSSLTLRVLSPDGFDLQCVLTGGPVRIAVESQAGPRAWTEYNTEEDHLEQVFGGGLHEPSQEPSPITVPGAAEAMWIPSQSMLAATDGTPSADPGTYVTIKVSGSGASAKTALAVAEATAKATFAARPDASS